MLNNPFFSVIIPTYNRAHLIGATIHGILAQTCPDFELVIVDDASTDNTKEVVDQFKDSRVLYVRNEENIERSASRNKGVLLAKGGFICFCDSDDHWRSNHLDVIRKAIETNGRMKAMYFTGMTWCFPERRQEVIFPAPGSNLIEYVIKYQIGTPTTSFHKSILQEFKFREDLHINEDVELFARIVSKFPLIQIRESTVDVIVHPENTKSLTRNYITPQIRAMEIIFSNKELKHKISMPFIFERRRILLHQLIKHYSAVGDVLAMQCSILKYLVKYPRHSGNKEKLVLLMYSVPGGNLIKALVKKMKSF